MGLALKRLSLATQVADILRAEIGNGVWKDWLPSERELSRTLHISRNTCRGGLRLLQRETLIEPVKGRGIRLIQPVKHRENARSNGHGHTVGVIMPHSLALMPPHSGVVLDKLREELTMFGAQICTYDCPGGYKRNPATALERLVTHHRHDCWVLTRSTEAMQAWFMRRGIPCVISGSVYSGMKLPFADQDRRALCRHAAGHFIALGHRRIAFLNRRHRTAGDLESEEGFLEAVRASSHRDIDARLVYHDDTRDMAIKQLGTLWRGGSSPTALLIANPYCYLSVASALAAKGLAVPADLSLISRDDETFLTYLQPEPARYILDPSRLARKLVSVIRPLLQHTTANRENGKILSRFEAGGTCRAIESRGKPAGL